MKDMKPLMAMVGVDLGFAIVTILMETVINDGMNHLVLITYRLGIAAISLAPIAYFYERDGRAKLSFRILCYLYLSSIIGASLTQYCFLLGIEHTSAAFACAFLNMIPVVTFIMALLFRMETVELNSNSGKAKTLGTVVCISGVALLIAYKGPALANSSYTAKKAAATAVKKTSWTLGCIALVGGTLLWSSWYLLQSDIGKRYPYEYTSTAIMSFFAATQSAVFGLLTDATLSSWTLRGSIQILTVLYSGMIGSGLCVVGMSWCVKKRGPVFTAAFNPLVQIIAAVFSIPVFHDPLYLGNLLGSAIAIIGLYILLWGKEMERCPSQVVVMEGSVSTTAQTMELQD
ncbi:WAT1-related protein At3g30340-like isoform X1 [Momordica charantia]|uniref:WAT1-related protein n=1 Tax=Momordica charantia TaxID=3673 RepID=A0A6J1DS72_MOMCH|nr:WAT1-related protein At3g30340-like isoform X1 [Momordica charantia]